MSMLVPSNRRLKGFLLCVFFLLRCADVCNSNDINKNKEALYYGTNILASTDPFTSNGGDFFTSGDKLYVLLWTSIGGQPQGGASNSILAFTSLNSKEWTTIPIPGKAYYLGTQHNNEICSIQPVAGSDGTWLITIYDISGKKIRELAHKYKKQSREYYHFMPIPLVYPDGSLIFYSQYSYETKNPITGFLSSLVSGGHGWKPSIGDSLEIVPELISNRNCIKSSFEYLKIRDLSRRKTIIGITQIDAMNGFEISHENINGYGLTKYAMDDTQALFYGKGEFGIRVYDKVYIRNTLTGERTTAPLPPLPKEMLLNGRLNYVGTPVSDIALMQDHNILFGIKNESYLNLFFFNQKEARWTRNKIDLKDIGQTDIRIICWQGNVYVGIWQNLKLFKVMRVKLADLMTDGKISAGP